MSSILNTKQLINEHIFRIRYSLDFTHKTNSIFKNTLQSRYQCCQEWSLKVAIRNFKFDISNQNQIMKTTIPCLFSFFVRLISTFQLSLI